MWNTKIIKFIEDELHGNNSLFKETPYYKGDPSIRKANLIFERTDSETQIMHDIQDPLRFVRYCKWQDPTNGFVNVQLRDYQEKLIGSIISNRYTVINSARQMGTTLVAAIMFMHVATNYTGKNLLYVTVNNAQAAEFLLKVKSIYQGLPFFMKPGVVSWNAKSIEFDNGCKIVATGSLDPLNRGTMYNFLYVDNAAYTKADLNPYASVVTAFQDVKVVISSTPNGYNWFYKLFIDAEAGLNEYTPVRLNWNLAPGRDELWKQREIKNLGSEELFNREYGLSFDDTDAPISYSDYLDEESENAPDPIKYEDLVAELSSLKERVKQLEDGR